MMPDYPVVVEPVSDIADKTLDGAEETIVLRPATGKHFRLCAARRKAFV